MHLNMTFINKLLKLSTNYVKLQNNKRLSFLHDMKNVHFNL